MIFGGVGIIAYRNYSIEIFSALTATLSYINVRGENPSQRHVSWNIIDYNEMEFRKMIPNKNGTPLKAKPIAEFMPRTSFFLE